MIFNCSNSNPVNIGSSTEQFAFSSSTCELAEPASSTPSVYNGFTYGEVIISFFLFLIFLGVYAIIYKELIFRKK